MECNKEEARRAKEIAERMMLSKDFTGAHRIIQKAQRLDQDIENISKMLAICDVHCVYDVKINGETDWYGILQVNQTADDITINKQYRKLALLLHPDKNNFSGAESAFKIIGEAQKTLLDKSKRLIHDMKTKAGQQRVSDLSTNKHVQPKNSTSHTTKSTNRASKEGTFWTMCTSCNTEYQFYCSAIDKSVRCQRCKNIYVAYDINGQQVPVSNHAGQNSNSGTGFGVSCQKNAFGSNNESENIKCGVNSENVKIPKAEKKAEVKPEGTKFSKVEKKAELKPEDVKFSKADKKAEVKSEGVKFYKVDKKAEVKSEDVKFFKVEKKVEVKSENVKLSRAEKKENASKQSVENEGERRGRKKSNEPCMYDISEDGTATINNDLAKGMQKKARISSSPLNENQNSTASTHADKDMDTPLATQSYSYPDPEFYDFQKERDECKFSPGQIWAIYGSSDTMPRFYALIKQVHAPTNEVQFNWLDPVDNVVADRYRPSLPLGCGSYKLGNLQHTQDICLFSHLMQCIKDEKRDIYDIFPQKGEVWALFKNQDKHRVHKDMQCEFEIVEIVSDSLEGDAFSVVPLVKIEGFVSLFGQVQSNSVKIQKKDMLRFSHKIPSYRLLGNEREGIPKGALELDCAALPQNNAKNSSQANERTEICNAKKAKEEFISFEYPDSEFYNFDTDKSFENFEVGQIWALYSDVDMNPNYYGQISKIELNRRKVYVTWLEGFPEHKLDINWFKEKLPFGCGSFITRSTDIFDSTDAFSHIMHANQRRRNHYDIYPCVGDIWAMYKNWSYNWSLKDLQNCEFQIVEVQCVSSSGFKLLVLSKVSGHACVYKREGDYGNVIDVPRADYLKFCHKIPAFKLTEEKGGLLRGCWELDSAAVPEILLVSD